MPLERLNKVLAHQGHASRRDAEKLITAGRVKVNGVVVTELSTKVDPAVDKVEVEAAALAERAAALTWVMLNKPAGVVCTKADGEGTNVMAFLPEEPDWQALRPVGRLDKESRGLIFLSNDGVLSYAILDPDTHLEKEYEVQVAERLGESHLDKFRAGMIVDGKRTRGAPCQMVGENRFRVSLSEGRNRQIRRMTDKMGVTVTDLFRIRIGTVELGDLPEGRWRRLSADEVQSLRQAVAEKKAADEA
jgi:23S rRNA pseudouridine2605 synthase/23S rRNA pseudouridine2604 synthase